MNKVKIDGKDVSVIKPTEIIVTIKNKKTGEIYDNEEALKLANIPQEDIRRDVLVKMPSLDLFGKTK
tara:strand:- start:3455 stop:3655 length:201 start_codon:yes stop_codon:yes gene_type:complete